LNKHRICRELKDFYYDWALEKAQGEQVTREVTKSHILKDLGFMSRSLIRSGYIICGANAK
jgi:hypothetical protein